MHYVIPQHLSKYAITVNMQYETESVMKGGLIQSHNERCCYLPITLNSKWSLLKYQPRRRYISTLSNRIVSGNWRYCPCLCGLFIHRGREREREGERVITEFLITKDLPQDVYEVPRISMEDAGRTARNIITVMPCLTTGIRSEKFVVRQFRRCANVIECTYTSLDSIGYYTPRLYGIACCSYATNLYSMLLY